MTSLSRALICNVFQRSNGLRSLATVEIRVRRHWIPHGGRHLSGAASGFEFLPAANNREITFERDERRVRRDEDQINVERWEHSRRFAKMGDDFVSAAVSFLPLHVTQQRWSSKRAHHGAAYRASALPADDRA
jgi:hypothetical protein